MAEMTLISMQNTELELPCGNGIETKINKFFNRRQNTEYATIIKWNGGIGYHGIYRSQSVTISSNNRINRTQ